MKKRHLVVLAVAAIFVALFAPLKDSEAGTPGGYFCLADNLQGAWLVDFGTNASGVNFDIHGFRVTSVPCNGSFVQPVNGTATLDGNSLVFGLWSVASSSTCVSASWHFVFDFSTFVGTGWYMTQLGALGPSQEGPLTMNLAPCDTVIQAQAKAKAGAKAPAGTRDPSWR